MDYPTQKVEYPPLEGRVVGGDYETTGVHWFKDRAFALSIATYDETQHKYQSNCYDLSNPTHRRYLTDELPKVAGFYAHYAKFESHFSRESGIPVPADRIMCTMIREAIIDENKYDYSLDRISAKYLQNGDGSPMQKLDIWPELAKIFGGSPTKEAQIENLSKAPWGLMSTYANQDSELCLRVAGCQDEVLQSEDLWRVHDMEMQLLQVVVDMEWGGVRVDLGRAEEADYNLTRMINEEQIKLNRLAGQEVNANSSPQVKKLVGVHQRDDGEWYTGDGLKLEKTPPSKKHPDGQASLDTTKLYQCTIPVAESVVALRGLLKARDTFVRTYMLEMNHDGYIHASINQTRTEEGDGTYTGRFSITDPALQQIHKRNKKMAAIIRACFVPDVGDEWWCYDWSQMDFRMFGHFLNDPRINATYAANPDADFHKTAADLTGLPRDRDEKTGGANAKQVNLAMVFGMGEGELAKQCRMPYTLSANRKYLVAGPEAKNMFRKYHAAIPGVQQLRNKVQSVAKSRGYIRTQIGRRVRFPHGMGAHKAAGLLYQATAADAMKTKLIEVHRALKEYPEVRSRLMLPVHDEFDFSVEKDHGRARGLHDTLREVLQRFDGVTTPLKFRIPVRADFGYGDDWWQASK